MERISRVRNRMGEICASGSVGGEGGNALAYPATLPAMPREKAQAAPTVRLKVPMRRRGADCLVVAMLCRAPHSITHADWRTMPNGFRKTPCSHGFAAGRTIVVLLPSGIV